MLTAINVCVLVGWIIICVVHIVRWSRRYDREVPVISTSGYRPQGDAPKSVPSGGSSVLRSAALADNQIKYMVDRFLSWRLPENFSPDAGISFKPMFNEHTAHPMKHEPTGTNLFDADQANTMVRHMMEGMPDAAL